MLKYIFCETKIGVLHLGFSSGDCSLTILTVKSDFCAIYFCQLISSRSKIRWKKITQNLDSPAQNCFIICPWIETQREDTHFWLIRNTFYHFKWKASSKTSNYWMFFIIGTDWKILLVLFIKVISGFEVYLKYLFIACPIG